MRIRTVKPSFFKSENVAELAPLTRLLFVGLWCLADREGRLEDRPRRIKVEVLPYDAVDCEVGLAELAAHGFIARYEVDGVRLIQVRNFTRHQRITGREADTPSAFPPPTAEADSLHTDASGGTMGNSAETPRSTQDPPAGMPGNAGRESEGSREEYSVGDVHRTECEARKVLEAWNQIAKRHGLPLLRTMTPGRLGKWRARLREGFDLVQVETAIDEASAFLKEGSWFSFDWAVKNSTNYQKLIEGQFRAKTEAKSSGSDDGERRGW